MLVYRIPVRNRAIVDAGRCDGCMYSKNENSSCVVPKNGQECVSESGTLYILLKKGGKSGRQTEASA